MKYFLLLSLVLSLFSCEFKEVEFTGMDDVKVEKFEDKVLLLRLAFRIKNGNGFKIKIKPSSLNVYVEGDKIGVVHLDKKLALKRKREGKHSTLLRVDLEDGYMMKMLRIAGKQQLQVRFEGEVRGSVMGITKKIKVDQTKTVDRSKLMLDKLMR